jgi:4-amino-4-deoxy-L-arabinose transferase-like glycosyltransferase
MPALSFRRLAVLLSLAAGLHGLLYVPLVSTNEETDSWTYVAAANAIRDGSYSTPLKAGFYYVFPTGWFEITGLRIPRQVWQEPERQAFRPPGYPAYLTLFGHSRIVGGEHTAALIGQAVLFALGAFLLMATVRRWWGESAALLTGLLYAVDPWSKHYVPLVLTETLAGLVAIAGLYALTRAWRSGNPAWWAAAGAAAGALALVRAVFVLAVPLVVVGAALRDADVRRRVAAVGATAAAAAALLVPWLAWTNHAAGSPVMAAWGEGYNFLLAADGEGHDRSAAEVEQDPHFTATLDRAHRAAPSAEELRRDPTAHPRYLRHADEVLRDEARSTYADRLRDEPLQVAWEFLYRCGFLWSAHNDWYQPGGIALFGLQLLDWVTIALALAGASLAVRRGGPARAAVVFLGVYTAVLGTHHVEARFAIPLRGIELALVSLALLEGTGRLRRS